MTKAEATVTFTQEQIRILAKNIAKDPIATAAWLSQLAQQMEKPNAPTDRR